jgi:hypothetical protein
MRVDTKVLAPTERLEVTAGLLPILAALLYLLLTC